MHQREIDGFMKALAPIIGGFVAEAMQPLRAENKRLSEEIAALKVSHEQLPKAVDETTIARIVDERVAKIPPGKDADPEMVAALVDKAVAALDVKGEPGASVTIADVLPAIGESVARHIAALPAAEPGKSVTIDDVRPMLQEMVDAIERPKNGESVTVDDVAPMIEQVVARHIAALPAAEPGKSVTIDDVRPMLQEMVDAIERPKNGESVTIDDVAPMIAAEVGKAVAGVDLPKPDDAMVALMIGEKVEAVLAEWSRPEDGAPGKSVTVDDVAPLIVSEVEKAVAQIRAPRDGVGLAGALIDREGQLVITMTDGTARTLGVVVGKDVDQDAVAALIREEVARIPVPKDGVDGIGFDDMALVDVDGDLFLRFTRGEVVKDFHLPVPTDRGVWVERDYRKGASVSWGGQTFIAQRDALASEKPMVSPPGLPWRMSVKKGRDGASAFDVARKAGFRGSEREWLDSLRPGPAKPVKVT